jgi:hypothetical protein
MTWVRPHVSGISGRRLGDFLLFGVTAAELVLLFFLTSTFTIVDWVYVSQHLLVLGIALTRPPPTGRHRAGLPGNVVMITGSALTPLRESVATPPRGAYGRLARDEAME